MPRAEVTLPGATSSVPTARRFVDSLLTSWGQPEAAWTAAVCVSELAGNCALHARTPFTVSVELDAGSVRIEVRDGSARVPSQRSYDTGSTTGRGLRLVAAHAERWGVETTPEGKTVWVLLALEGPLRAVPDDEEPSADGPGTALGGDGEAPSGGARVRCALPAAA